MSTPAGRTTAEPQRSDRGMRRAEPQAAEPVRSITPLGVDRMAQRKGACACGGGCPRCRAAGSTSTSAYTINTPGDRYEQEADRVAEQVMRMPDPTSRPDTTPSDGAAAHTVSHRDAVRSPQRLAVGSDKVLQRACAQCTGKDEEEETVLRKEAGGEGPMSAPPIVDDVVRSAGQPLDYETRSFMEPRFGEDFGDVRVHTDGRAAESASAVRARAYTVGRSVVFGSGEYRPGSDEGRRLLAHELTHVVQQRGSTGGALQRSVVLVDRPDGPLPSGENPPGRLHDPEPATPHRPAPIPQPEHCPPPQDMICPAATTSPGTILNALNFPQNVATLNAAQKTALQGTATSWHSSGGSMRLRVDGYASAEGECSYNWNLSCRRAQAIVAELTSPSDPSVTGVPSSSIELFAHGESNEFSPALAPNRNGIVSIRSTPPPPPPAPTPPSCALPVLLGSARGCGGGPDFGHFDYPPNTLSLTSAAKLAAWAAARPFSRGPFRSLVTNLECEVEMDGVLRALAGSAGHAAFSRFAAGTGGVETHGPGTTLGAMALVSGSFARTVAAVKAEIERQLAAQAPSGVLDPCALSVLPPATHFGFSDGTALKAVIGGTQGERLFATAFTGSAAARTYSITLNFRICDDFGVDESDLYSHGLFAFWVLQHERSATLYAPFINELDLTVTVGGSF